MLAALSLAAPASPAPIEDKRLRGVHTWAMAIGTGALANVMRRPGAFDLVVVDGEEIRRAQVLKLRRHGTLVLGYLSVGTIESYRWWHSAADPYKLELWGDWGEWYADVSRLGFRDLIANRVAPGMLNKGLTGLFLDNTDMVETHAAQRPGMQRLVRRLARLVHSRNRLLFTQNGQSSLGTTLALLRRLEPRGRHVFIRFRYGPLRSGRCGRTAPLRWQRCAGSGPAASS